MLQTVCPQYWITGKTNRWYQNTSATVPRVITIYLTSCQLLWFLYLPIVEWEQRIIHNVLLFSTSFWIWIWINIFNALIWVKREEKMMKKISDSWEDQGNPRELSWENPRSQLGTKKTIPSSCEARNHWTNLTAEMRDIELLFFGLQSVTLIPTKTAIREIIFLQSP